ncbi:CLUMA_CG019730, isoform A [Clunio marinus]|uniref:CLUMA_CG019730, isoform A n=1 Tax=Clunio marinus TaxID=568069 RepID=A0A1J1J281_9DIPT|nr:CLUMA_CG019730, isoform A [Clunio marinus]
MQQCCSRMNTSSDIPLIQHQIDFVIVIQQRESRRTARGSTTSIRTSPQCSEQSPGHKDEKPSTDLTQQHFNNVSSPS